MKPNLFIASSVEGLPVAQAVELGLYHQFNTTIWTNGVFNLSSTALEDLLKQLESTDFAIFIFSPDDVSTIRKNEYSVARDNVIFELGLYTGKLGRKNIFILTPSPLPSNFHRPSDLAGVNFGEYDSFRQDNLQAAVSPFVSQLKLKIFNASHTFNGKWIFTWEAPDSKSYPDPVSEEIDLFHFEQNLQFLHTISSIEKYKMTGEFDKPHFIGRWRNITKVGYDGVFQMKLNGKGDCFEGIWSGWNSNGTIGCGPCKLERKKV